jgi:glycosyltransferase involved in cell wall biosynthesis
MAPVLSGNLANRSVVIVGHPFAASGRGENIRATHRSLLAAGVECGIYDIYGLDPRSDLAVARTVLPYGVSGLSDKINIFVLNGDEVERAFGHLGAAPPQGSYNIIFPAWELPKYPPAWVTALERFDEVWAQSRFTHDALASAVRQPVVHMSEACEVRLSSPMGRRQFGIPEQAYAFLFFFDFSSYVDRKNPFSTIEAFARLRDERPATDLCLILKTNTANAKAADRRRFEDAVRSLSGRLRVIDQTLTDNETKNLVHCCDCFVSLHRSEGFGHGLSEAMYLGKPVIATRYSGNLDFMNDVNSFLVDCDLVPVGKDQYVFPEGQVWAQPRLDQAVGFMRGLVDSPDEGRRRGRVASRHIRQFFSYRAMGLRYRARLEYLVQANRLTPS